MRKLSMFIVVSVLFIGCVSVQDKVNTYKEKRDVLATKIVESKEKKDCIVKCNQDFNIGIDRADCKAKCILAY